MSEAHLGYNLLCKGYKKRRGLLLARRIGKNLTNFRQKPPEKWVLPKNYQYAWLSVRHAAEDAGRHDHGAAARVDLPGDALLRGDATYVRRRSGVTARVERELIVRALEKTQGNVAHTARLLKISRKSLQTKMKELGLRDKD